MPPCDQTGVPIHFHSSTTNGSASLMSFRILPRVSPRQSPSSAILSEMSSDAGRPRLAPEFFMSLLFHGAGARAFHRCASKARLGNPLYSAILGERQPIRDSAASAPGLGVDHLILGAGAGSELQAQRAGLGPYEGRVHSRVEQAECAEDEIPVRSDDSFNRARSRGFVVPHHAFGIADRFHMGGDVAKGIPCDPADDSHDAAR